MVTKRFQLNLSSRPFPRYRSMNVLLSVVLILILGFSVWEGLGFIRYTELAEDLKVREQEARVEWEYLGERVATLEERLNRPESVALLDEIRFLDQVIERRRGLPILLSVLYVEVARRGDCEVHVQYAAPV